MLVRNITFFWLVSLYLDLTHSLPFWYFTGVSDMVEAIRPQRWRQSAWNMLDMVYIMYGLY